MRDNPRPYESEDLEHRNTQTDTHSSHLYAHTPSHTRAPSTHTYTKPPPASTNHWTISYNPPPASAAALTIQTNCPSSSARCRKRHKARADSWAGTGSDLEPWQPLCCSKNQDDNVLAALRLSACITVAPCDFL